MMTTCADVCPFRAGPQNQIATILFAHIALRIHRHLVHNKLPALVLPLRGGSTRGYLLRRVFPSKNKVSGLFVGSRVLFYEC